VETTLADENIMSLRSLSRFRSYLVSSIGDLKRKVVCVLDQVFPEYQTVFSNVFGKTSTELLLHFQTADDFEIHRWQEAGLHKQTVINTAKRLKLGEDKLKTRIGKLHDDDIILLKIRHQIT